MVWTAPKTDWKPSDTFDLDPDYARIRGNLLHLAGMAQRLYPAISLAGMADCTIEDIPGADFFNALDGNADALLDGCFRPARIGRGREYAANGQIWNADDLNRIERATIALYDILTAQENTRPMLAFTMGGDLFGACI